MDTNVISTRKTNQHVILESRLRFLMIGFGLEKLLSESVDMSCYESVDMSRYESVDMSLIRVPMSLLSNDANGFMSLCTKY